MLLSSSSRPIYEGVEMQEDCLSFLPFCRLYSVPAIIRVNGSFRGGLVASTAENEANLVQCSDGVSLVLCKEDKDLITTGGGELARFS